MWVVGSNIVIGLYWTCGHVVSVVCFVCGCGMSNIMIGLSVLDMWSVLFVYVGRM